MLPPRGKIGVVAMVSITLRAYAKTKADRIEHETGVRIIGVEIEKRQGKAPRVIRTIYGSKNH